MRVTLLYFAAVRDLVGIASEEVDLPASVVTVGALGSWLEARHEPLAGRLASVRFALDEQFAGSDEALHDGAVVALIPPVAGG
ncbi:MAG: MoaD/ThiS family protein [Sandaracinaceae bacterium]